MPKTPNKNANTEINITPSKLAIPIKEAIPNLPIKNAIALKLATGLNHIKIVKILKKNPCATSKGLRIAGLYLPPNAEIKIAKTNAMTKTCKVLPFKKGVRGSLGIAFFKIDQNEPTS